MIKKLIYLSLLINSLPGECNDGFIEDCNGECGPEGWVDDGICDDGTLSVIDFNCEEFDFVLLKTRKDLF